MTSSEGVDHNDPDVGRVSQEDTDTESRHTGYDYYRGIYKMDICDWFGVVVTAFVTSTKLGYTSSLVRIRIF